MNVAHGPAGRLELSTSNNRAHLSRLAKAGRAMRLAPGIYVVEATLPYEAVVRHHLAGILAHVFPGGVLCGRTALAGGMPVDGWLYVAHPAPPRTADLAVGTLKIRVQIGPGPLPGDAAAGQGIWIAGAARQLVENVDVQGRPARSRAGTARVEDQIDRLASTGGAGRVANVLAQLDVIASSFDARAVAAVRNRLLAVLGSFQGLEATSPRLRSRLAGLPFDTDRIDMLEGLIGVLNDRAPSPRPASAPASRWEWLPFFEAYFSNFIEGTEFGVDEARRIAVEGYEPASRPADAHDVSATYRLAADPVGAAETPATADQLVDLLRRRHGVLLAARPEKRPGEFKEVPNFAGGYRFVEPELVEGTLRRGFEVMVSVTDAFARAISMMVLLTEVHPFDDGNGRLARLFANAELGARGQARIVIPTVYRANYLSGLAAISNRNGHGEGLISILDFAQRWTTAVDWTDYGAAVAQLASSNAFDDAARAELEGRRLQLPARP